MDDWREIPGFNGRYRIRDGGAIERIARGGWLPLAAPLDKHGYALAYLWNGRNVRRLVHQLVAEIFIGPRPADCDAVNHLDGVKLNNHSSNLEWTTRSENMRHAWRTGLCKPQKLDEEKVREILTCGGLDTPVARRFGVSQVLVTKIRAGKAWRGVYEQVMK